MAGFISLRMAPVLQIVNYISPIKYGSWVIMNVVFRGLQLSCNSSISSQICPLPNGESVLKLYNMQEESDDEFAWHIYVLAALCLLYMSLSYAVLRGRTFLLSR